MYGRYSIHIIVQALQGEKTHWIQNSVCSMLRSLRVDLLMQYKIARNVCLRSHKLGHIAAYSYITHAWWLAGWYVTCYSSLEGVGWLSARPGERCQAAGGEEQHMFLCCFPCWILCCLNLHCSPKWSSECPYVLWYVAQILSVNQCSAWICLFTGHAPMKIKCVPTIVLIMWPVLMTKTGIPQIQDIKHCSNSALPSKLLYLDHCWNCRSLAVPFCTSSNA